MATTFRHPPLRTGFYFGLTSTGWKLVGFYVLAHLILLVLDWVLPAVPPISEFLLLSPPGGGDSAVGFRPWQIVTAPLVYPPGAGRSLVLHGIALGFVGAGAQRVFGRAGFLRLWFVASLGSGLLGAAFGPITQPQLNHFGFGAAVMGVLFVYCLENKDERVPFLLVFPVALRMVAYAIAIYAVVVALNMLSPLGMGPAQGGYLLGGVLGAYLWWRFGASWDPGRLLGSRSARRRTRNTLRDLSREWKGRDEDGGDGPVYH
jgi:hypothetical protein